MLNTVERSAFVLGLIWFTFVAQIYIAQFFQAHGGMGWINQPLVQLPWFHYLPARLNNPWLGVISALLAWFVAVLIWSIRRALRNGLPPVGHAIIVDAIFGTGLDRPPAEPVAAIIEAINASGRPIVAVDVPSGLDCDTGRPLGACIRAEHTITFVAEKVGFESPQARAYLGEVTVGDIGVPRELVEQIAGMPLG